MSKQDSNIVQNNILPDTQPNICGICLDECNLPVKVTCGHMFCYLCIKQWCYSFALTCPLCRRSINEELIEKACSEENLVSNSLSNLRWQYESRTKGEWWFYNKDLDEQIELKWNTNNQSRIHVDILGTAYTIDFAKMKQISPTGAIRNIKRHNDNNDNNETRGIAGLIFKDKYKL